MRLAPLGSALTSMVLLSGIAIGQSTGNTPTFDVASVKSSQSLVGPDENNRFSFEPSGLTGRNVMLKRLVAEAYHLQLNQILGPAWLNQSEYDIDAKTDSPQAKQQLAQMLRILLAERFKLSQHSESRNLRVYELVIDKAGPKIRDIILLGSGETPTRVNTAALRYDLSSAF